MKELIYAKDRVIRLCMVMIMLSQMALIECQLENHKLKGIGYREQELQQAKGSRFTYDEPVGIYWASFAGGTNIFIEGYGFNPNAESNTILLTSEELGTTIVAPALTEDDAFGSHVKTGFLQYRLPSVSDLLNIPRRFLDSYLSMTFYLSVKATDGLNEEMTLACDSTSDCRIRFYRSYTPVVQYLSPPVVYYEQYTEVWFNPKSTQDLIQELETDEMRFINTKIAGNQIDFEFNIDYDTSFSAYRWNRATGQVGDQIPEASQNLTMLWETGYADNQELETLHCSYDNATCYQVKTVPVIFETSSNTGYRTGGQNLTLKGHGLDIGTIKATVDGIACAVTQQSNTEFSCFLGEAAKASETTNSSYIGHHGLRRTLVNTTHDDVKVQMNTVWDETKNFTKVESIATTFTSPYMEGDYLGNVHKGWFVAPATTKYRFYMACDDNCLLRLGKTPGLGPEGYNNTEDIISIYSWTDRRHYFKQDGIKRHSEWIALEEGQHYYIESHHVEGGGGDHVSVAVEIEQTAVVGHHHAIKEIQYLGIDTANKRDTMRITIENVDEGQYILTLKDPTSGDMTTSSAITVGCSTSSLRNAIVGHYYKYLGSNILVERFMYDVNGTETESKSDATKFVYNVTTKKLIEGSSLNTVYVSKTTTKSTIKVEMPTEVQTSQTPLSGKFRVKCIDKDGFESYSEAIGYNWGYVTFGLRIMNNCTGLYDRIETWDNYTYSYKENGRGNYIHFKGINEDPGQFELVSDWDDPLQGEYTFVSNTTQPYGTNLFYDPVPFEMLKTYDTIPQIVVTVNDLPAVCHNITCGFNYTEPVGEIASFTFDTATNKVTVVGTSLPADATEIYSVEFAQSLCTVDSSTVTATGFECTLDKEPTCGTWVPKLTAVLGVVPNAATIASLEVACSITAVQPDFDLNIIGGDNITISGEHFPWDIVSNTVVIKFNDADATVCTPQDSKSTYLVCLTESFSESIDASVALSMTIVINNLTVSNSLSLTLRSTIKSGTSIAPASVSPVLKQNVTIQLESDFPYTLVREDFTVNATSETNSSYTRYLNVIDVDDANKQLICKFGGAYSGQFSIKIRHAKFGLVKSTILLDVSANTTSVDKKQGSIYGGTLLTISGSNYGSEITDNPVQISTLGSIGSLPCFVITTSASTITCRLDERNMTAGLTGDVVVFLKTSEESPCVAPNCAWTYTSSIPTLSTMQSNFDTSTNTYKLMVTGTDFTGDTSSTELYVGGKLQKCDEVTTTSATFTVTDISEEAMSASKLYFDVGVPANSAAITAHGLKLEPKLVSLSVNEGSIGGSIITANVQGVGPSTTGFDLVDSSGKSICQKVSITSYGVVECHTIASEIAADTQVSAKLSSTTYTCSNTDTTQCQYKQLSTSGFPVVTSVDISTGSMVFTGTGFYTSTYTANATFCNVYPDTLVVDSPTQVTAKWTLGIPPCGPATPALSFSKTDLVHYASAVPQVTNDLTIASSTAGLKSSWAGGQQLQISAAGISSLFKGVDSSINNITVCEKLCEFNETLSTDSYASCTLPVISTSYSDSYYNMQTSSVLRTGDYISNRDSHDPTVLFDQDLLVYFSEHRADCYMGMNFKTGYKGVLDKVKYYVPGERAKSYYINKLTFQGSNDDWTTHDDLFTLDDTVSSGWNYVTYDDPLTQPKYNSYRFFGNESKSCYISEIELHGFETIDSSGVTHDCTPTVRLNGTTTALTNAVTYDSAATPNLTAISPRFGTVKGGETVTFTGTGFPTSINDVTIIIDGVDCAVQTASETQITCTTTKRPGYVSSSLQIYIAGKGNAATNGLLFTYVNYWSHDSTWGGEFAPLEGESIHIPTGLNLYMDIDSTPELNLLIVEGELILAPNDSDPSHHRTFDAHYILVSGGKMQVGTEDFRYTSKITITMHGTLTDPYLPLFGNKCIGLTNGILDMHGPIRTPTWTVLSETVNINATKITLNEQVDWVAGEEIAIASTSFDGREAEKRTIVSIDNTVADKPVITLDKKLDHKHFAATETFGDKSIEIRAEVGLLSRNIVFKGDDDHTEPNQYGAIIFMHSAGDDSLAARLSYTEFTQVGQAFKQGRYPIHFHLIGEVPLSYALGNSVHLSFNRAFTIHGTKYLRIIKNVAYNTKGHTIFIEDGIERRNHIEGNLIMMTKRSWSLLNTDQTPACFWITNPDNDFIGNHAAGSDRYGYWYDLQKHSIGPSADTNVCPENEQVGIFKDNHAHSNGRYGLRIFHNMVPRKYPCSPIVIDEANTTDPWWKNPIITANFYNLTSWKNKRNGAIAERVGDVRFHDFKVADNQLAGIEFSLTGENTGDNKAGIYDSLVIGKTSNEEPDLLSSHPYGIINPRTDNFTVKGIQFYNFDWTDPWGNEAAALSSCSHCFHPAATDSGARTITFSNLFFDTTVKTKIRYQYPWKAIFYDLDGTLTGKGPKTWATYYYGHHEQSECETNLEDYDGVICDSTVQVRRVSFRGATPGALFAGMGFKILPYDDSLFTGFTDTQKKDYLDNSTNYGSLLWKKDLDTWATPFVTGHKYKIHWGQTGIDFETMTVVLSEKWEETDKALWLVHNYTDVRSNITVHDESLNITYENNTISGTDLSSPNTFTTGQNIHYEDNNTREFHMVINGKGLNGNEKVLQLAGIRCDGSCVEEIVEVDVVENTTRYWSDPASWPDGKVPADGEDVHIESGWNVTFDMEYSPVYQLIRVNGFLSFLGGSNLTLNAKHIFIRAGELHIGSKEDPYNGTATIKLHGEKDQSSIVYTNAIEAGNKLIANVNKFHAFGLPRQNKMSRLLAEAKKGENSITVETGLDWVAGDRIALLATSYDRTASDDVFIESYDNTTGILKLNSTLNHYHWGQAVSPAADYNGIDIRGEVVLLTRNVKIVGEDVESWGGQVVTSDSVEVIEGVVTMRTGQLIFDNVEVFNASQIDTLKSAIRFESAATLHSSVTNCTLHNGYGWGMFVKSSKNIQIADNIIYNFRPIGVAFQAATNITFNGNVLGLITQRETLETTEIVDKRGAVAICSYFDGDTCTDVYVYDNIVAGAAYAGFLVRGHECGDYTANIFRNNVAHSIHGEPGGGIGAWIFPDPATSQDTTCFEASNFTVYKATMHGIYGHHKAKRAVFSKMTSMDNIKGFGYIGQVNGGAGEYGDHILEFNDNKFYGETAIPDCPNALNGDYCNRDDKYAFINSQHTYAAGMKHQTSPPMFPVYNHMSDSAWGGKTILYRNKFINFKSQTTEGMQNAVFGSNEFASDYTEMHEFFETEFENVENDAIATLQSPDPKWANKKDCGYFPCTAPYNILYSFKDTTWTGNFSANSQRNWQMIANNPGFSPYQSACSYKENWNGYECTSDTLSILLFENNDWDSIDRNLIPIFITQEGTPINNTLNSFMDHIWDGFYTGQQRVSRYPALVNAARGTIYDVVYTGSTPKNQTFQLKSQNSNAALVLRIFYPDTGSFSIYANDVFVASNDYDDATQEYKEIQGSKCGENRFLGLKNILEFYITSGCFIKIKPRDAIQTMVRMEWSLDQFFSNGGTTTFADRVSSSLGIHASDIKIVSVYEGSLVVNYDVTVPEGSTTSIAELQAKQTEAFATGSMDLGAPILDVAVVVTEAKDTNTDSTVTTEPTSIVSDGTVSADGYEAIVITKTAANTELVYVDGVARKKNVFRPNIRTQFEEETIYQNITVQKIVKDDSKLDPEIIKIKKRDDGSTSWIILVVSVALLVLAFATIACKYFQSQLDIKSVQINLAEKRMEKKEQFAMELEKSENSKPQKRSEDSVTRVGAADAQQSRHSTAPMFGSKSKQFTQVQVQGDSIYGESNVIEIPEYAEQYDPNQDFAIFQVGNKATGGIMTMQEKMNVADDVEEDSSEEEPDTPDRAQEKASVANKMALANQGQIQSSSEHASGSAHSKKRLTFGELDDLPEDQEIVDEEEEEDV